MASTVPSRAEGEVSIVGLRPPEDSWRGTQAGAAGPGVPATAGRAFKVLWRAVSRVGLWGDAGSLALAAFLVVAAFVFHPF